MIKKINWNGFLEHAVKEYPKEACAFLFSKKPNTKKEEWYVFSITNVADNPEEAWIPDKKEMLNVKSKATKLGLVKIGNVHTHPYYKDWKNVDDFLTIVDEIIKPSEKDLYFARKFNDVVRIIICVDDKKIYGNFIHDKFGNKLDITLTEGDVK